MKNSFKIFTSLLFIAVLLTFSSCSDNPASANLKTDLAGSWNVTRTIVTPSADFPNGYQDQQLWSFTVNGNTATITTSAGTMNGVWDKSTDFNYDHWIFEATGTDPRFGTQIKVRIEIIAVDKLKGTNETYFWDPYSSGFMLSDAFSIVGDRMIRN
jgi:hypothetical protein